MKRIEHLAKSTLNTSFISLILSSLHYTDIYTYLKETEEGLATWNDLES